jgi:uncharacterized membrane protein
MCQPARALASSWPECEHGDERPLDLCTIVLMALATYLTRISGYLLLGTRELSPRTMAVLDIAPGCELISVIAPFFVSGRIPDMIAMSLTTVAATRLPLLPTRGSHHWLHHDDHVEAQKGTGAKLPN